MGIRRAQWWTSLAAFCLLWLLPTPALAVGGIDRSFGDRGVVDATPNVGGYPYRWVDEMRVAPGGRIYLLDEARSCGSPCATSFFLTRLDPDGSRDRRYGDNGNVFISSDPIAGAALATDNAGRPLVALAGAEGIAVVRLRRDGRRDGTFGSGGTATLPCNCAGAQLELAVDSQGRILIQREIAEAFRGPPEQGSELHIRWTLVVTRLLPDGRPDPGFGAGGTLSSVAPGRMGPAPLAVRPGGSAVSVGSTCCQLPERPYALGVTRGGQLDPGFQARAEAALAALPQGASGSNIWSVLPGRRGRVDLLGSGGYSAGGFLMRLLPGGNRDAAFGRDGIHLYSWRIYGAATDRDGNVFTIGTRSEEQGMSGHWLRHSGRVIGSFGGGDGVLLSSWNAVGAEVAMQRGRRPVVFEEGAEGCRQYCPPHPRLVRFTAAPRHRGRRAHR